MLGIARDVLKLSGISSVAYTFYTSKSDPSISAWPCGHVVSWELCYIYWTLY